LKKVLVKKSNNQVLVKKAARTVFPISGGPPVMMLGGGGGGGSRGRTLRERAGGALGGLVGVAGALTGSHRSLGGLTNAMVSGGATGSQLGSALGRKFVGRRGQARADLREAGKQADAERDAKMMEATRSRGQGMGSKFNPVAAVRRRNFAVSQEEDERLRRANQANQAADATRAEQDKENKRMGVAVRQGMYRDAGRTMGEEARRYEEMGRSVEEFAPNFMAGMETMRRVNVPEQADFEPTDGSYPVAVIDSVTQATNAAQANPTQAAANFNSVPQPGDGAGAETGKDAGLENAANYGEEAIDDDIDVQAIEQSLSRGDSTSTPNAQGTSSSLNEKQSQAMEMFRIVQEEKRKRMGLE
jgi:hypothetical protein